MGMHRYRWSETQFTQLINWRSTGTSIYNQISTLKVWISCDVIKLQWNEVILSECLWWNEVEPDSQWMSIVGLSCSVIMIWSWTWFPVNASGNCQNRLSRSLLILAKWAKRISCEATSATIPSLISWESRRVVSWKPWSGAYLGLIWNHNTKTIIYVATRKYSIALLLTTVYKQYCKKVTFNI